MVEQPIIVGFLYSKYNRDLKIIIVNQYLTSEIL